MSMVFATHRVASRLMLLGQNDASAVLLSTGTLLRYSVSTGTAPDPDVLTGGVPATQIAAPDQTTGAALFDSGEVWVVITVVGTGLLSLVLRTNLDDLDTLLPSGAQWAQLAKISGSRVRDWQEV